MSKSDHKVTYGWRYANIKKQEGETYLIDPDLNIGVYGDWFIHGRIEASSTSRFDLTNRVFIELPL